MDLQEGDKVSLIIETETALGYTVLINDEFDGLLFRSEVFQELEENMEITGYIKTIREDGKIEVWSVESRQLLMELNGHQHAVSALQFDSGGNQLASAAGEADDQFGVVKLWNLN